MNKRLSAIIGILLLAGSIAPAHAATFRQGDTLNVDAPVDDDLYAVGGNVTVRGAVTGDLFVAGGTVRTEGRIGNTMQAAGGQVSVMGPVTKSARVVGGTVIISTSIDGDLVVGGGQVTVESGAVIGGDLVMFGGTVALNGTVRGALKAYGGELAIGGRVGGAAEINAERVTIDGTIGGETSLAANTLKLGPNASLENHVRYWTEDGNADLSAALQKGGGTSAYDAALARTSASQASEIAGKTSTAIVAVAGVYSLFSSALILLVLFLLGRTFFRDAGIRLLHAPWMSMLIGFLYFAATPVAILILLVTIIGIPIAFAALCVYVFSFAFGGAVTALTIARAMDIRNKVRWSPVILFLVSLGILVALKLLAFVPILGWILRTMALFMATGAVATTVTAHWKRTMP